MIKAVETMAKAQFVEVNGVAREVNTQWVDVNNVARKVRGGFVDVNGVARQFFSLIEQIFQINKFSSYVDGDISYESDGVVFTATKNSSYYGDSGINFKTFVNGSEIIQEGTPITITVETLTRDNYSNIELIDYDGSTDLYAYVGYGEKLVAPTGSKGLQDMTFTDFTFEKAKTGLLRLNIGFWNSASEGDCTSVKITKLIIGDTQLI